jgi:hypothetical protein
MQAVLERPHVADALPDAAQYAPVAQKLGTCSLQPNPARRTSLAQYVILLCSPEKTEVEVIATTDCSSVHYVSDFSDLVSKCANKLSAE